MLPILQDFQNISKSIEDLDKISETTPPIYSKPSHAGSTQTVQSTVSSNTKRKSLIRKVLDYFKKNKSTKKEKNLKPVQKNSKVRTFGI